MAIFHLAVRTVSRGSGRSAVAAAAYRAGERLYCERTGLTYDYSARSGVVATRIVVPQSETTIRREALWNRAETAEGRRNSTLAREWEVALPHELDAAAREGLAFAFAEELASRYGIAVDVAIHEPSVRGDSRNFHAHLLTTTRSVEADGSFGKKVRVLDERRTGPAEVVGIREMWAAMCTAALTAAGVEETVDHRSHAERGLEEAPGTKLGVGAAGYEARTGERSRRRTDHAVDAREPELVAVAMDERSAAERKPDPQIVRANALRMLLAQLHATFAAATTAVLAGRPAPVLEAVFARTDGRAKSVPPPNRPTIGPWTRSMRRTSVLVTSGWSQRTADPIVAPQPQAATRNRRHNDEEAETAEMHRRVERELEAEHLAHLAQDRADAQRAAARSKRVRLFTSIAGSKRRQIRMPASASSRPRGAVSVAATGSADLRARVDGDDDHLSDRGRAIVAATPTAEADGPKPVVDLAHPRDAETLGIALMIARQLMRMHKLTRPRVAQLADAAGMTVEDFQGLVAGNPQGGFERMSNTVEPVLADLWDAWKREDKDKQRRDRQDEADDQPEAAVAASMPMDVKATGGIGAAENPEMLDDDPATEAESTPARAASDPTEPEKSPYTRRDAVIDLAILIIARRGWRPAIGDALAEELGTRRDWISSEARRVCSTRYGARDPTKLSAEKRENIWHGARRGAARHSGLLRNLDIIYAGRIPPSRRR